MSDDDVPEEAGDNVTFLDMRNPRPPGSRRKRRGGGGGKGGGGDDGGDGEKPAPKKRIPVLPPLNIDVSRITAEGDVLTIDAAAVNLRIYGRSFHEIAQILDLGTATEAKQRIISALAKTHPTEDWETVRALETARAEQLLNQSMQMASAAWLVDANDPDHLMPNEDRIRWHSQAREDLALHATITGAKAPVRYEFTPTDQEYSALVGRILELDGHAPVEEYDILDAEVVPDDEPSDE